MPAAGPTSPIDARLKVVALALEPAFRLAHLMALPLADLQELVATGYFREARARGLSLRAVARRFGKSLRTVASLSRRASEGDDLLQGSLQIAWRRRAVSFLNEHGPATMDQLHGALALADAGELAVELAHLVEQGILARTGARFRVRTRHMRVPQAQLNQRLDSLRHAFNALTRAAYLRFYRPPGEALAFTRVLSFRAAPGALESLAQRSYQELRAGIISADAAADDETDATPASVLYCVVEQGDNAWRA